MVGGEWCRGVDAILPGEAWSGGDKLEQPASVAKAVNEAVHQYQVSAHPVQEVVCSVILEICLVWHGSVLRGWRRMSWLIMKRRSSELWRDWKSG